MLRAVLVSIHAPVKGATSQQLIVFTRWHVSIHAPVKGATFTRGDYPKEDTCFNSRSREGSDPAELDAAGETVKVSIHAPVKGATA